MPELTSDKDRDQQQKTNSANLENYLGSPGFADHLRQILPDHLEGDRFATIALRQTRSIPQLRECTMASVAGAIMQAASLGLEIGLNGACWLIPRQEGRGEDRHWEASLQIGYLGHLDLAWRSGMIAGIDADIVIRGDKFAYQKGTKGFVHHVPAKGRQITMETIEYAYAVIQTTTGGEIFSVIDHAEINRLRNSGPSHNSPAWANWPDQMSIGKVLKRVLKLGPRNPQMARAVTLDDAIDANIRQNFDADIDIPLALPAPRTSEAQEAVNQMNQQKGDDRPEPEPVAALRKQEPAQQHAAQESSEEGEKGLGF